MNNVKNGQPIFKPPPDEQERQERPPDELLLDVDSLNNNLVNNNNTGPLEGEDQSAVVVVTPAASLDSFTADSDMMMMATSMLGTEQPQQQVPEPAAVSGSAESFYYRDRLLPPGWYVKIGKKQVAENSRPPSFSPDPITVEDQCADFYNTSARLSDISRPSPIS